MPDARSIVGSDQSSDVAANAFQLVQVVLVPCTIILSVMINDAKIKFHLSGDTNMDEIGTEPNLQSGPYRNIVSTIAKLNRHVGEFYLVLQITNKPAPMQIDSDSQVLSFLKLLTKREEQVYSLAINGATNKSIADQLYISVETVKCHRKRIIKKAGVRKIGDIKSLIIRQSKMLE